MGVRNIIVIGSGEKRLDIVKIKKQVQWFWLCLFFKYYGNRCIRSFRHKYVHVYQNVFNYVVYCRTFTVKSVV